MTYALMVEMWCTCTGSGKKATKMKLLEESNMIYFCPFCGKRRQVRVEDID